MDNTIKTLIIIVVILVAVLGVAGGFILQSYLLNSNKNATSVNQTNASTNSSINNTTSNLTSNKSTSTNSGFISSQKAIDIAKTMIESDPSNVYYTEFVNGLPYGSPYYYRVYAMHQNSGGWSYEPTEVDVNAKTGHIITTYVAGGTNDPLVPD